MNIELSSIDEARFGVVTAKVVLDHALDTDALDAWCSARRVEMLIARCPSEAIGVAQSLERSGARLMDTLVYFAVPTPTPVIASLPEGYAWRYATAADSGAVGQLAASAFGSFSGHYHADAKLDQRSADAVYASWAERSCLDAAVAKAVLLVTEGDTVAGFLTLRVLASGEAEIVLNAVAPAHQGRGLYGALVALARHWSASQGCRTLLVSTQLTNIAPQKVWCRHGFEPRNSFYTFHKWYTP